jgi:hypothetical protein
MVTKSEDLKTQLPKKFLAAVRGQKIVNAYYDGESGMPVLMLDDGAAIFVQQDDEGNGPGVPVHVAGEAGKQVETGMWEIRGH